MVTYTEIELLRKMVYFYSVYYNSRIYSRFSSNVYIFSDNGIIQQLITFHDNYLTASYVMKVS